MKIEDQQQGRLEWPTLTLILLCSALWLAAVWLIGRAEAWWALPLLALPVALHSSLQHEVIHDHPTRWRRLNDLLVFPAIGLFLPFHRFRDQHLDHHLDSELTNPSSDPESPYVDAAVWQAMPGWRRQVLRLNQTLAGRLAFGPMVSMTRLIAGDIAAVRRGERRIAGQWLTHLPALMPVMAWLWYCGVPVWLYALLAAYPGMSVLMLRTFAEHRWDEDVRGRSVIVERGGIFALLFLNNHLHAAHHFRPGLAWYRLPELARSMRADGLVRGESFRSYGEMARRYLFRIRGPIVRAG